MDDRADGGENGRRYLVGAGVVVTAFAGTAGYVLGANSDAGSAAVFGLVTVPVTPASLGAYGLVLAGSLVTGLFGLVALASRLDSA